MRRIMTNLSLRMPSSSRITRKLNYETLGLTTTPFSGFQKILSTINLRAFTSAFGSVQRCRPIYMDYQATTPVDPRVLDSMMPFYVDMYGNPHSRSHSFGWEAEHHVEESRRLLSDLLGTQPRDIFFTSGATESNNMILKGVAGYFNKQDSSRKRHIVTTQIEHKCVLASCRDLQEQLGWDVTYLGVGKDGIVSLEKLEKAIKPETALVSVIHVNNEIGVIQPLDEIGRICREKDVLFHSDAAQSAGKIPINIHESGIDLLSISGHKLYGPKGVGALVVRTRKPRTRLIPLFSGGGQERGLRSGTLPVPLIVGLGAAAKIAGEEMKADNDHVTALSQRLRDNILRELPKVTVNGSLSQRYRGNLNMSFEAVEGESLLMSLKNIALSSGSACTSASLEPSYVLRAMGVDEDISHTSLRFGFGRFTTPGEVDACSMAIIENVRRLREISPLWDVNIDEKGSFLWT